MQSEWNKIHFDNISILNLRYFLQIALLKYVFFAFVHLQKYEI